MFRTAYNSPESKTAATLAHSNLQENAPAPGHIDREMKLIFNLQFNNLTAENKSFTELKQAVTVSFIWVGWYGLEWLGSGFLIKWTE